MKLERLKQRAKEGNDVVLLVIGGGEVKGRIVRFEESGVILSQDGHEREIFEEAIIGFELTPLAEMRPSASASSALPPPALPLPSKPKVGEKVGFIQLPQRPRLVEKPTRPEEIQTPESPGENDVALTGLTAL